MITFYQKYGKRLFDVLASSLGLVLCLPLFAIIAFLIKLTSDGPVFFQQERMGRAGRLFRLIKFRTMRIDDKAHKLQFTPGDDNRVTKVGLFLRRTKVDELPGLINVFKGDMSIVGPRPEVAKYAEYYSGENSRILSVRPGLSDHASVIYRDEESFLARSTDPELTYVKEILPKKLELNMAYAKNISLKEDTRIIALTIRKVIFPGKE